MIKKLLCSFLLVIVFFSAHSQPYGNEWITYTQEYYRINIIKDGIYRIDSATLAKAGIPVTSVDPRSFQIFGRGEEQYIYVKGESDGNFNNGDYIEFYAEKNDGWFDSIIYDKPSSQANSNYSLFTDTASYYFTWNSSVNNRRMKIETDINFSSYTPLPYFYKISRENYTSKYYLGATNSIETTDPEYTIAEGWFDYSWEVGLNDAIGTIKTNTKTISTKNAYKSNPNVKTTIEFTVVGASDYALSPDHDLNIQFAGISIDTNYEGYTVIHIDTVISTSKLGSTNTDFIFSMIKGQFNKVDRNAIAYISVKYPHTFDLENESVYTLFVQDAVSQTKALLNVTNFNVNSNDTIRLYDLTNHKRIKAIENGNNIQALIPNSGGEKKCYLTSDNKTYLISSIIPVSSNAKFTNYMSGGNANSDYIIISHKKLWNEAEQYKTYRALTGYQVLLADINELYDQYSYGIRKNPLAVRNFLRNAITDFSVAPQYVFLIGKSYKAENYRRNATFFANTLVPTFGNPPSDVLLTAGIVDTLYQPAIATGRLSAKEPNHVQWYLDKIQSYESAPIGEWMKNVLHFAGGNSYYQQQQLLSYLNEYKAIIEDTLFGGYVRTISKISSNPIQNVLGSVKDIINNEGVSLMTFFGHAAGTIGFDINIDDPSTYNNEKYPFLLANSCLAGDIFDHTWSSSEAWVLIKNKGVIGYLASVGPARREPLYEYSKSFYENISNLYYGQSVGKCIQQTIKKIQTSSISYIKDVCLEMTLHADPAIIINSHSKPDYVITPPNVYFNPAEVTTEKDSFDINIIATNIGKAVNDSFIVELKRTFPDGTDTNYFKIIKAPYFKNTTVFKLPINIIKGIGLNTFKITLDALNDIDELDNLINNTTEVNLLIKSSDIIPVYPYKYAIIPNDTVALKASTSYPILSAKDYVFEIDTTDYFNSPFKLRQKINHIGGVVTWTPPVTLNDSGVYYWRVSLDSAYNGKFNWRESSFQYIKGKRGWGQAHFYQFKNDKYQYVNYNKSDRKFGFAQNKIQIIAQTGVSNPLEEHIIVNNITLSYGSCTGNSGGMKFAVFDSVNGEPWYSKYNYNTYPIGDYGNYHCNPYDMAAFHFFTTDNTNGYSTGENWRRRMKNFIEAVPAGNYVLVMSHINSNAENYNDSLYRAFKSCGCVNIDNISNSTSYICFGKKRNDTLGVSREAIGSPTTKAYLEDSIKTIWYEGFIESELIGPASNWGSLHWRYHGYEPSANDSVRLNVIGIKTSGVQDTLIKGLYAPDSVDIYNLQTRIDARIYPYMKLIVFMKDTSTIVHTPAHMDRWQVIYDGIPETALDPSIYFRFYNDTVEEGDSVRLAIATHNISDYDMDSLLIHYWLIDNSHIIRPVIYKKVRKHPAADILIDSISINTHGLSGLNSLWIEVNPINIGTGVYDQLEQYHFNNIGQIYFYINKDKINPLLDVTFDGVHILDGDLVSSEPEIQITLNDENKYLALDDTSCFEVYIKSLKKSTIERIHFNNNGQEIMKFFSASLPDNTCRIEFNPLFVEDGTYQLLINAKDKSKNISGDGPLDSSGVYDYDYKISFEVINKSTITEVLNWPNPFSTSTRFVFTLTGREIPTYFKIQIMTITGKIVKEITQDEIGPIHIGRNITQYAWDGKDQYGDQLANGLYLYRVITNINGKEIEKNATEANKYFVKEFGKMYLIR